MRGKRVMVTGSGTANSALVALLLSEGMIVTSGDTYAIEARPEIDEYFWLAPKAPANAYGPERKGKGGKVKRW